MKTRKKWICLLLPPALTLVCFFCKHYNEDAGFTTVASTYFEKELTSDTLSLHYTLANPEKYGIRAGNVSLPCYETGNQTAQTKYLHNVLASLAEIDADSLSDHNRYLHTLLTKTVECKLRLESFPYYYEPLSPNSGMHTQLLILLAEYPFYDTSDIDDYLALLSKIPPYLESLYLYEQEKAAAGLLMSSSSLQKTIEGCRTILTKEELMQGEHFLQETFSSRLAGLQMEGKLTDKEYAAYLAENDALLTDAACPAYEKLAKDLTTLYEFCTPLVGLAHTPSGKEYYKALLRSETGSYRSIEDINALLCSQLTMEQQNMSRLATPDLLAVWDETQTALNKEFPLQNPEEILQNLRSAMGDDFPSFPDTCTTQVKTVAASLENYTAPAFYLTPPVDAYHNNVIYINESQVLPGLDNYTTLAHEGFPGHLYQNMYSSCHLSTIPDSYLRSILWYGGYLEGWAIYTEFLSYDYASQMLAEKGNRNAAAICSISKHNRSFLLALYALMDMKIHYEGALEPEIASLLSSIGVRDGEVIHEIYSYIVEEPTNYMKYYLGYLEIMEIKKQAQSLWGETYSDYRFHKFLLEFGPADFDTLSLVLHRLEEDA